MEDVTLKGMSVMGMSPIVVLATTSAEPLSSNSTPWVLVTAARNVVNAMSFMERSGCFEKEIPRSTMFPVDMPPTVLDCGNFKLSYTKGHPLEHGDDARKKGEPLRRPGHLLQ